MVEPVSLNTARDDTLWAVVASMGRTTRVAEIFSNHIAALADKAWREQQVRAYANFLRMSRQPVPRYDVKPIKRAELPRAWRPLRLGRDWFEPAGLDRPACPPRAPPPWSPMP
jgi:hypothetical protein